MIRSCFALFVVLATSFSPARATLTATILAGGETALPADTPSGRLDTAGEFPFVGALEVSDGSATYRGSAVALSDRWLLTAGHNADLNDDLALLYLATPLPIRVKLRPGYPLDFRAQLFVVPPLGGGGRMGELSSR